MAERPSFREEIAAEIIARIEAGTAPWQKPWDPGLVASGPFNPTTGATYRGINDLWLTMQGHADPRWMTYKQAAAIDAQVRKGEKATTVEYWQWSQRETLRDEAGRPLLDDEGRERIATVHLDRPRVFLAKVFNASQIDGLPPLEGEIRSKPEFEIVERAEAVLAGIGVPIHHDQRDRAFYSPMQDAIHLPARQAFASTYDYYATALHEAGHATRHDSRLARPSGAFGTQAYAREELRAEIASYMLARETGLGHNPDGHAAYVESWLKALRDDHHEIFRAARDADTIRQWLLDPDKRPELERQAQAGKDKTQAAAPPVQRREDAMPARTYLTVPYEEKAAAKAAGAKWDARAKSWYAPEGADEQALNRWRPSAVSEQAVPVAPVAPAAQPAAPAPARAERTYLAVPYTEKNAAKAAGAKWDKAAKSWYAPEDADRHALARWQPGKPAAPELSPEAEFAQACKDHGLELKGPPNMDGQWHRAALAGDRKGEQNGSYRGFLDGRPAGQITNYKTGQTVQWVATGQALTPDVKAALQAEAATRRATHEAEIQARADQAAHEASVLWRTAEVEGESAEHPYLLRKDAFPPVPLCVDDDGRLLIPMRNAKGQLRNMQTITPDGEKRYLKGGEKTGLFHMLDPEREAGADGTILIAEGYATGVHLYWSSGCQPVAVAFDASNLLPVAEALRAKYPQAELIIAADDDHALPHRSPPLPNTGIEKAEAAARAVNGKVMRPPLTEAEKAKGLTDWADIHAERGPAGLRAAIKQAWPQPEQTRAAAPAPTRDHAIGL